MRYPGSKTITLNLKLKLGARLLHADTGGGEVDVAVETSWAMNSTDYSLRATMRCCEICSKNGERKYRHADWHF